MVQVEQFYVRLCSTKKEFFSEYVFTCLTPRLPPPPPAPPPRQQDYLYVSSIPLLGHTVIPLPFTLSIPLPVEKSNCCVIVWRYRAIEREEHPSTVAELSLRLSTIIFLGVTEFLPCSIFLVLHSFNLSLPSPLLLPPPSPPSPPLHLVPSTYIPPSSLLKHIPPPLTSLPRPSHSTSPHLPPPSLLPSPPSLLPPPLTSLLLSLLPSHSTSLPSPSFSHLSLLLTLPHSHFTFPHVCLSLPHSHSTSSLPPHSHSTSPHLPIPSFPHIAPPSPSPHLSPFLPPSLTLHLPPPSPLPSPPSLTHILVVSTAELPEDVPNHTVTHSPLLFPALQLSEEQLVPVQ